MQIEGYNDDKFKISCFNCGSDNCDIVDHDLYDEEDNLLGKSCYVFCNACGNSDI